MIPAVAQTLANLLAKGTSLGSVERISFNLPREHSPETESGLSLYFYDIREIEPRHPAAQAIPYPSREAEAHPLHSTRWFSVSFVVSAQDYTTLGAQQLLSETLLFLLQHHCLSEDLLCPLLRGYGDLPLSVEHPPDLMALWQALDVPLRPALYVTVITPFVLLWGKPQRP